MRMRKSLKGKTLQTGAVILLYALLLSAAFAGCILLFSRFAMNPSVDGATRLIVLPEDALGAVGSMGEVQFNVSETISMEAYNRYFFQTMLLKLLPYVAGFFVLLLLLTALLWKLLHRLQKREAQQTADALFSLHEDVSAHTDTPILNAAYAQLEQKLLSGVEDYKRLSFYLAHEQKNALAILQASLETGGHHAYDSVLTTMKSCIDDILTLGENADAEGLAAVDVPLVCAEVCDRYRKIAPEIRFDFPDTEDAVVAAKERWINRAVSNLLDNAVKYGEGRPIAVAVNVKKHSVIVTVEDHSVGIPEESMDAIFACNRRLNALKADGYGIGLSLVAHVCDICGGYAYAESTVGVGSRFTISLPQAHP